MNNSKSGPQHLTTPPDVGTMKEGGEGRSPEPKRRKLAGRENDMIRDLVTLLFAFLGDLGDPNVSVEEAANFAADNLRAFGDQWVGRG